MEDDQTPPQFTLGNRAMAGVMVLASLALLYVSLDIVSGGAITRALSHPPEDQ